MEKGTASAILFGHDVGVGGKGVIVYGNELRVDAVASTILKYVLAEGILANETGSLERKIGAKLGQVQQDVVGRSTRTLRLAKDIGQLLVLGINVYDLYLVYDPVAAGQNATAFFRRCCLIHVML